MESNRYAPPRAVVAEVRTADDAPPLWNPNAAANWSLLFSPVFGAWLHMTNWRALGDTRKAEVARNWMIAAIVVTAAQLLAGRFYATSAGWTKFLSFFCLLAWYFASARGQARLVKERWGSDYPRRSWTQPLLIGVLAYVGWYAIVEIVMS
jgi:hypothetical protein